MDLDRGRNVDGTTLWLVLGNFASMQFSIDGWLYRQSLRIEGRNRVCFAIFGTFRFDSVHPASTNRRKVEISRPQNNESESTIGKLPKN
jgi:hypothetical protein